MFNFRHEDPTNEVTITGGPGSDDFGGGRWSSFSWSSLYEGGGRGGGGGRGEEDGGTDSSLSWADDEIEREATERVCVLQNKSLFPVL